MSWPGSLALKLATYEKGNKDGGVHENQGPDGSPAVAETVGDGPGQEDTDKGAALTGLEEGALPPGWDGPARSLDVDTVFFLERGKRNKVTVEEHVKRLHDLTSTCISSPSGPSPHIRDSDRSWGWEPACGGIIARLTMVKHMMNAHSAAQGYFLTAVQTPISCSRFSPSTASLIRSRFAKTSEWTTSTCLPWCSSPLGSSVESRTPPDDIFESLSMSLFVDGEGIAKPKTWGKNKTRGEGKAGSSWGIIAFAGSPHLGSMSFEQCPCSQGHDRCEYT